MDNKWLRSTPAYFKAGNVNEESGVIEGIAIITLGEAKGHGVFIDSEFLDNVVTQGNALKQGLKVRYGHPSMSSTALGTFLGREKNFRREGDVVKADLFLSNEAKIAPGGNLYEYVLGMAKNESDMLGTSIVFIPGESKFIKGDKREFATLLQLLGNDVVDDPAANPNGLFSQFNTDTLAGQMSEFLDTHPDIEKLIFENPLVIDGFIERHKNYKNRRQIEMSDVTNEEIQELESNEVADVAELEKGSEKPVEKAEELSQTAEPVKLEAEADQQTEIAIEVDATKERFEKIESEFGIDIAVKSLKEELSYEQAQNLYNESLRVENEKLSAELEDLKKKFESKKVGPVSISEPAPAKKSIFRIAGRK